MKSHQRGILRKSENEDKVEECVCWCAKIVEVWWTNRLNKRMHKENIWNTGGKKLLHGEAHEEPAEWAKCLWTSSVTGALGWGPRWWRECWKMSQSETQILIQLTRAQVWWRQGNWKAPCWKPTHQQGGRPAQKIIPLRNLSRAFLEWVVCYSECESWWVLVCLGESGRLLPALKVDLTCGWEPGELPAGWPWGFRRQGDLLQATWWRLWSVWAWWTMWTWPIRWTLGQGGHGHQDGHGGLSGQAIWPRLITRPGQVFTTWKSLPLSILFSSSSSMLPTR